MDVGGSEANVAIALSQLGWGARMLSALPDSDLGNRVCSELNQFKVDITHIARVGERIGLYYLEEGDSIRSSKIIYDRTNSAINDLNPDDINWEDIFEGITHLHWSAITPALSENVAKVCQKAVDYASTKGVIVSCDLHYRKNLWAYGKKPIEVIPPLIEKSSIVLGDPSTIQALIGLDMPSKKIESIDNVEQLVPDYRRLMDMFPQIKSVSMLLRTIFSASHHKLKAVMVTNDGAYESSSINVDSIKDRIGGGDAYMAGVLYGLSHYEDKKEGLEFAIALSALKHTIRGDYFTGNVSEIEQVMNAKQLGRIVR
jgi:2-dehydro-3-deoxygluconokinase